MKLIIADVGPVWLGVIVALWLINGMLGLILVFMLGMYRRGAL